MNNVSRFGGFRIVGVGALVNAPVTSPATTHPTRVKALPAQAGRPTKLEPVNPVEFEEDEEAKRLLRTTGMG